MADLFLWNIETKQCKFSEVKSQTDSLSDVQKEWIAYLSKIGMNVEVCYIKDCQQSNSVDPFSIPD